MVSITERRVIAFFHDKLSRSFKSKLVVRSTNLLHLKSFVDKSGVILKVTIGIEILTDDERRDLNILGFHKPRLIFINYNSLFSKNINFKNSFQVVSS